MAYAAVASLGQTLDRVLHPDCHVILHHKRKLEHLRENLLFLQAFLETSPSGSGSEALGDLETRIRDAAYEAQDIIERMVYLFSSSITCFRIPDLAINSYAKLLAFLQIMFPSSGVFEYGMRYRVKLFTWPYDHLNEVTEKIDLIVRAGKEISEACVVREGLEFGDSLPVGDQLRHSFSFKSTPVGLDDNLLKVKDRLTGSESKLEVVPIVGMGGIGKTTLTERLYTDALIEYHFDARGWVTISQSYNVRDVLLRLLKSLGMLTDKVIHQGDGGLAEHLYKMLCWRRYLIVMDDVWSTDAWDDFRRNFPDNHNGSRIILTTRLASIATYAGSCLHHMQLLCNSESWKLLRTKVFGEKCCPRELEEIGLRIAFDCGGLPLAIVVMAGLLCKVNRAPDEWEKVADNLHSAVSNDADSCLEILSLSYHHLDQHLKACFLYMGAFPEDSKISVSKVIKLWAAEGFLKEKRHKTLEDVAKEYIMELAERSLISVSGKRRGKEYDQVKTISIHDLLWDLCIREAKKEKFLSVIKTDSEDFPQHLSQQRRISIYPNLAVDDPFFECLQNICASTKMYPSVHSLLYPGSHPIPVFVFSGFKLLCILDLARVLYFEFPVQIFELCNLRYLALCYHGEVPVSISKLWNLQTLIFSPLLQNFAPCPRPLPLAIWSMPHLRHFRFHVCYLDDFPSMLTGWKTSAFLEELQTLSDVHASFCAKEVLQEVLILKGWESGWKHGMQHLSTSTTSIACINLRF